MNKHASSHPPFSKAAASHPKLRLDEKPYRHSVDDWDGYGLDLIDENDCVAAEVFDDTAELVQARAEQIACAVNSHEQLVAALRGLLYADRADFEGDERTDAERTRDIANAQSVAQRVLLALAAAKGAK